MSVQACPTCGERPEGLSRYMSGSPAYLTPCGHFVEVHSLDQVTAHPEYADHVRERDVRPECWETWGLATSLGGRPVGDPPLRWVLGYTDPRA